MQHGMSHDMHWPLQVPTKALLQTGPRDNHASAASRAEGIDLDIHRDVAPCTINPSLAVSTTQHHDATLQDAHDQSTVCCKCQQRGRTCTRMSVRELRSHQHGALGADWQMLLPGLSINLHEGDPLLCRSCICTGNMQ